jgi:phage FluMu gp28-like protein
MAMDLLTSSALAGESPFIFIRDWARTFDEVEAAKEGGQLVRSFPQQPYIKLYIEEWQERSILLVPKSRRMLATWTFCALDYWLAAFRRGATIFVASTMRNKSDALLARCKFIHDHLPEPPTFPKPRMEWKNGQMGDPTRLIFPDTGSVIMAVSEDPDELRQSGATLVHCEEFAFWQWQEKAWTAIRPVVQGGGKIVVVSTPLAGTFFRDLVMDEGSMRSEAM